MSRATAKVFKTARSQAVRIPKDFRLDCDEVFIERRGREVILTPKPKPAKSWREYFRTCMKLSPDSPDDIEDFPPEGREPF